LSQTPLPRREAELLPWAQEETAVRAEDIDAEVAVDFDMADAAVTAKELETPDMGVVPHLGMERVKSITKSEHLLISWIEGQEHTCTLRPLSD
jgi:hypothetical protein